MPAIQLRNRIECHTNRVREQVQTSDFPSTKEGLHLGPHLLNGIQIGTVGRKVQNFHPLFLQDLPDSFYMVRAHIVHHNNVSRLKDLYYDALEASQGGWYENADGPTPFIKYLLSVILAAYRELDERLELVGAKAPAVEVVRRAVESRLGKFTKTDILELCPTMGKTSVESSLKKLVDQGILVQHGKGRATFYTRAC